MKYDKPPLTFDEQVQHLLDLGLRGDPAVMRERLASVNYYRLSGYLYPYRDADNETFLPGTDFDTVWQHYAFDRRLRLLVMDAIERIEIAVRTQLAYHHARAYNDPFAYAVLPISLPGLRAADYLDLLARIRDETDRSEDTFVSHFRNKYGDEHAYLPIWMAVEIMSLGATQRFFRGASHQVKKNVATHFGLPDKVIDSWLHTLSVIRNICAHHGRLWNKELGVKPFIPFQKDYPDWHTPYTVPKNRVFAVLTVCRYCLRRIAPQSRWPHCLDTLLADFPNVPLAQMGFPANWRDSPLWR
ncbi:MAG TPA: Abi family protein [Kiritimatiellia bacterium]|nr:Abi family protein [Kiritimatiellia bacterium]